MKNSNVCEFRGDIEKALKNGEINQLIVFKNSINYNLQKFLNSLGNIKEIEASDDFPYTQTQISFRSPFRIGTQKIKLIHIDNIINNDKIDSEKFKEILDDITKHYQYSVVGIPICGTLLQFSQELRTCIKSFVKRGKVAII